MWFYSRIFHLVESEAELIALLAHEISHELHNDFLKLWHDHKQDKPVFGRGGVLEESQAIEASADETGARLMYEGGWDPRKMIVMLERLKKLGIRERHGAPTYYSTHPRDPERMKAVAALIESFPPKEGLIQDPPHFQELKKRS